VAEVKRAAVVLFNLGGPDSLDAVGPFLSNLFNDPAIIAAPGPIRWAIAKLITHRRTPIAKEIYSRIGGASPILAQTEAQARALEAHLAETLAAIDWRVEIAMRYWHPFADEAARRLHDFAPDRIILLPLYPQYSGTTTGSSARAWHAAAAAEGLSAETVQTCCYPDHPDFIAAQIHLIAGSISAARKAVGSEVPLKILLSAHGLPKKVIARGDPYQWQVERTAAAIERGLEDAGLLGPMSEVIICYQSRVGPLEWIGPATDDEIKRAGAAGAGVVIAPIAFVSEHSETLVELDMEYAALGRDHGVVHYTRVPAVACDDRFIACLADLVSHMVAAGSPDDGIRTGMADGQSCARQFAACPYCG
jgi:ferrochelatase